MATEDLKKLKDSAKAGVDIYLKVHKLLDDFSKVVPDAMMLTTLETIRTDENTSGSIFQIANDLRDNVRGPLANLVADFMPYNQAVRKMYEEVNLLTGKISEFENRYLNLKAIDCRRRDHNGYHSLPSSACSELGVVDAEQVLIESKIVEMINAGNLSIWNQISQTQIGRSLINNQLINTVSDVRKVIMDLRVRMESRKRVLVPVTSGAMLLQHMTVLRSDPDIGNLFAFKTSDDDATTLRSKMIGNTIPYSSALGEILTPLQIAMTRWNTKHESKSSGTDNAAKTIKRVFDYHSRMVQAITVIMVNSGDLRSACEQLRRMLLESAVVDNMVREPDGSGSDSGRTDQGGRATMGLGHELGNKGHLVPPGRVSGFLFRVVDPVRISRYVQQVSRFSDFMAEYRLTDVGEQLSLLEAELDTQSGDAKALMAASTQDGGLAMDEGDIATKMKALGDRRVRAALQFASQVRDAVGTVVKMHRRFMLQQHAEAARYMQYWRDVAAKSKKVDGDIVSSLTEHREVLDTIASTAAKRLASNVSKDINAAMEKSLQTGSLRLSNSQYQKIGDMMDSLAAWVVQQNSRINRLYATGKESLIESLLQPEVLTIYGLKVVRLVVVWMATTVASRAFQAIYRQRVYAEDAQPPHPAAMVAMAIGLDAVAHIIIGTVLMAARTVWHIETSVLQMWALDWALVSVLVVSLSLILSHVVYSKKYFRYKYEGERGIRALQELMLRIYLVAVPIPFFRLTFG